MQALIVRRLLVDMTQPIARHWCDADPFKSAFFNALSMSFPIGEQFFIDSVRSGLAALPADQQTQFSAAVQGFVGQEATHRRLHALYNQHLQTLGLVNHWEGRARRRLANIEGTHVLHPLAITAANEHFTAIFANWLLSNPQILGSLDPRLSTLWLWHSAEESEHRSTAFDLYRALQGNEPWRLRWFRRTSLMFVLDIARQTFANLQSDGTAWHWKTWRSAAVLLFGKAGLIRQLYRPWKDYLRSDFHPDQHDDQLALRWLEENAELYSPVGAERPFSR